MKNLLLAAAILIMASSLAFAHNEPVSTTATFDCRVISLLSWAAPQPTTLEEVIAGQTRTFTAVPMAFVLSGEAGYSVTIHCTGPTANTGNPAGVVTLAGSWDFTTGGNANLSGVITTPGTGSKTVTYSCTGVTADAAAHGSYSFTLNVDAVYAAL